MIHIYFYIWHNFERISKYKKYIDHQLDVIVCILHKPNYNASICTLKEASIKSADIILKCYLIFHVQYLWETIGVKNNRRWTCNRIFQRKIHNVAQTKLLWCNSNLT